MKLIKLDATDSTNSFLKGLTQKQNLESYTVVSAKMQTNGKGQMGSRIARPRDFGQAGCKNQCIPGKFILDLGSIRKL